MAATMCCSPSRLYARLNSHAARHADDRASSARSLIPNDARTRSSTRSIVTIGIAGEPVIYAAPSAAKRICRRCSVGSPSRFDSLSFSHAFSLASRQDRRLMNRLQSGVILAPVPPLQWAQAT